MKLIHEGVKNCVINYSKKAHNSFCTAQELHKRNRIGNQDRDTGSRGRPL
jgi:hypothetical protein